MQELLEIYYTDINTKLSETEYRKCIELVGADKEARLNRFRFEADKWRSLYGDVMARLLFIKKLGIDNCDLKMKFNEYGKPYFENINQLKYNISHSGEYVLCGISSQEIGVDVEIIRDFHESIAKHFYTKEEFQKIETLDESAKKKSFYQYWTMKESYVKYCGKGLSIPLDSFSIMESDDMSNEWKFKVKGTPQDNRVALYSGKLNDNHLFAVAYNKCINKFGVVYKNIKELLDI